MLKSVLLGLVIGGGAWLAFRSVQAGATVGTAKNFNNQIGRSLITTNNEPLILKEDESGRVFDNQGRLWV